MKNEKRIMNRQGVRFADIFKIIAEGNSIIIHYSIFTIHY